MLGSYCRSRKRSRTCGSAAWPAGCGPQSPGRADPACSRPASLTGRTNAPRRATKPDRRPRRWDHVRFRPAVLALFEAAGPVAVDALAVLGVEGDSRGPAKRCSPCWRHGAETRGADTAFQAGPEGGEGLYNILDDPEKLAARHSAAEATSTTVAVHCGSGTGSPCLRKLSM